MYENIAAISTANGTGGVAIIRISGKNSLNTALKMFKPAANVKRIMPNYMYSGNIIGDGFEDYGFMVYFKAPKYSPRNFEKSPFFGRPRGGARRVYTARVFKRQTFACFSRRYGGYD